MAQYPKSGSLLQSRINSNLSTQITIKVDRTTVGAIQQLQINQNREMWVQEEIGTDGIIEIHPKGATKIDINVTRIVFDQLRLPEAFARGFINIQSQRIPFDIQIMDRSSALTDQAIVVNTCHSCWFNSYSPTYAANDYIITETAGLKCEYMTTTVNGLSAANGGLRGIRFDFDSVERSTDVDGRRGRLDSSGQSL